MAFGRDIVGVRLRRQPGLPRARRLPAGRDRQDHVHSRAGGVARPLCLDVDERRGARHAGVAASARRRRRPSPGADRRGVPADVARFPVPVGAARGGGPMWGTYWVWDARLTSVLVLFLMYLGVIALWRTIDDPTRAARAAAVLTLVGAINIPIIKFSVDWWNTLHQPASVLRLGGSTIHPTILVPLIVMLVAFTLLFLTLHLAAMRNEIMRRRVRTMMMMRADATARP